MSTDPHAGRDEQGARERSSESSDRVDPRTPQTMEYGPSPASTRAHAGGDRASLPLHEPDDAPTSADHHGHRSVREPGEEVPTSADSRPRQALDDRSLRQALEEALRASGSLASPVVLARRWAIQGLLGAGAFGVVVRARDLELARDVAIKLQPVLTLDEATRRAVVREAQALARLDHPNVVTVHSYGEADLRIDSLSVFCLYIEMSFVEGESLRRWLKQPRTREAILDVLMQAGEGLAAAHESGLVHRDFKPDNVMIDARGRAYVVDFGLAKAEDLAKVGGGPAGADAVLSVGAPNELARQLTQTGVIAGTPDYMAPEVWDGRPAQASDQYAFAVVAWEALTAKRPPPATPARAAVQGGPALEGGGDLDAELRTALIRALSYEAGRRYADMRALLIELSRHRATATPSRRGPRLAPLAAVVFLAAAGVVALQFRGLGAREASTGPSGEETADTSSDGSADPGLAARTAAAERCKLPFVPGAEYVVTAVFRLADKPVRRGSKHYLSLHLEPESECEWTLRLSKTGDDNQEHYPSQLVSDHRVKLTPGKRDIRVAPIDFSDRADGGRNGRLELVLRKNGGYGDLFVFERDGQTSLAGPVFPGHSPPGEQMPEYDALPCLTQCRLLCAGVLATDACIIEKCEDERATVGHCGAPTNDWPVPGVIDGLLAQWPKTSPLPDFPDNGSGASTRKLARKYLEGRWTAMVRMPDGSEAKVAFRIETHGANLDGKVTEAPAPWTGAAVAGQALNAGPWVLRFDGASAHARWILTGWDPAFGKTDDGALVALRHE